jgi:phage-related protein
MINTLLSSAADQIANLAGNAGGFVNFAINLITNIANAIVTNAPALISALWDLAVSLGEALINYDWSSVASNFGSMFTSIFNPEMLKNGANMIVNLVTGIAEGLPQLIASAGETYVSFYSGFLDRLPEIATTGMELILNLVSGIMQNLPAIVQSITQVIANLISTIIQHLPEIVATGIKLIGQLVVGIIQAIPQIVKALGTIVKTMVDTFKNIDWKSLGKNLIDGIVNGLKEAGSKIWEALKSICSDAFDKIKDFFKIGSPSRLMADEVGYWLPAGIAQGVESNVKPLTDEMRTLASSTVGTVNTALTSNLRANNANVTAPATSTSDKNANVYKILEQYLPAITNYVSEQISVNDRELLRRVSRQNKIEYTAKKVDVLDPAF